jgi:GTPase
VTPTLGERVVAGDPRAIARAISLIEDEDPASVDLVRSIFSRTGRAYLIGVTGPPGAGKSTLVDRLVSAFRTQRPHSVQRTVNTVSTGAADSRTPGTAATDTEASAAVAPFAFPATVGVIAVDPTSPFSGGAVLGDRLRMQTHAQDAGVFIRSMATRGHLGGLARATGDAALVLDAAGIDLVIIETVGVGQDEVDIIRTADVSIVTLVPGTGDEVQALKAGIMEIADIFVVNKADREGADRLVSAVEANLGLHTYASGEWRPPIIKTAATSGAGVPELVSAIASFREHSKAGQASRRKARSEYRLRELVSQRFMSYLERDVLTAGELGAIVERIAARELDPYTAANELLTRAGLKARRSGDSST